VRIAITNTGDRALDHIELETAEQTRAVISAASVDRTPVVVARRGRRIVLPLPVGLEPGRTSEAELTLEVPLAPGLAGDRWFHASARGLVQASGWLPAPGVGFIDRLDATVDAPPGMRVLAGSSEHARELVLVAADEDRYRMLSGEADGIGIRVLHRDDARGREGAAAALRTARAVLPWIGRRLGRLPRDRIVIAQVRSDGRAWSWPGIIWLPDDLSALQVEVYLSHELAHQWFGGVVSSDHVRTPFAAEGPSELISRRFLDRFRSSACPGRPLDQPAASYGGCLYEALYVDGANLLERIRGQVGERRFWAALRSLLREHRWGVITVADLLGALDGATRSDLRAEHRDRFPDTRWPADR
jgi:hypothetical protein